MREALNSNPLVQAAVIGVLLIGAAFFVISTTGGGEVESSSGVTETTVSTATTGTATPSESAEGVAGGSLGSALSGATPPTTSAPPLPKPVLQAWKDNETLVLLFVRDGGIDDRIAKRAALGIAGFRDAALFVVPAHEIYRYAAISEGVGVERTPALVVVTPKHLDKSVPTASISYGFQSPESVAQAVVDAGYEGPTVEYHP